MWERCVRVRVRSSTFGFMHWCAVQIVVRTDSEEAGLPESNDTRTNGFMGIFKFHRDF